MESHLEVHRMGQLTTPKYIKTSFAELDLVPHLLNLLNVLKYENLTPIQSFVYPYIWNGNDVMGSSQTGIYLN